MIEKNVNKLVEQLQLNGLIGSEMREHYFYAILTMVEKWITVGSILILGIYFRQLFSTICFLIMFFLLREHTGGFHAPRFWQCYIGTIVVYILIVSISPFAAQYPVLLYLLTFVSSVVILFVGTVNHPNMDMDQMEKAESQKAARYVTIFETVLIAALVSLGTEMIYIAYMCLAIILCAFLLCLAKIIGQEVK